MQETVDSLQALRDRADTLIKAGDHAGIELLERTERWLAERDVAELTRGSASLQTRIFNFYFEMACGYATFGDVSKALDAFKRIHDTGGDARFAVREARCPPLAALRDDPRYQLVVDLWRSESRRWGDSAFASPYRDQLPENEMIAGLSQLWSQIKFGLPSFETAPGLDLDSLYLAFLPQVRQADNTFEY